MFNLRGNGRTSGERCRQEGEPLFAAHGGTGGSLTPIAITLLVKKPNHTGEAQIYYHDIGMYLKRKEKLARLAEYKSILSSKVELTSITPNEDGDWLNKRNEAFQNFIPIEPEKKFDEKSKSFFTTYAIGLVSNRDSWVYNYSKVELEKNVKRMVDFYNKQVADYKLALQKNPNTKPEEIIEYSASKISWTRALKNNFQKKVEYSYKQNAIEEAFYRPFCKQNLYNEKFLIEMPGLSKKLFPTPQSKNLVISVYGLGNKKPYSTLISNCILDLNSMDAGAQCFPLYWYENKSDERQQTLFDSGEQDYVRHDAISDFVLQRCRTEFGYNITKEDIFYYVYGLLHSPIYKETFSADLTKMLPRIPLVKSFWEYSKAGRELAELHLNYENQPSLPEVKISGIDKGIFDVDKIKFKDKQTKETILYNPYITISNIPSDCYKYTVNGKSPIEWVLERFQDSINKDTHIRNNPNDWGKENNSPKYILNLILSLMSLSIKTLKIINNLPDIKEELNSVQP